MKIGENIKLYRKQKGLTQLDLAIKSNISRSYLADIENNRYNPSLDVAKAIAEALGMPVENLFKSEITTPAPLTEGEILNGLSEEDRLLYKKIKALHPKDAKRILNIIDIFEKENKD